jgi:predicted PurR-regulated permease PerM
MIEASTINAVSKKIQPWAYTTVFIVVSIIAAAAYFIKYTELAGPLGRVIEAQTQTNTQLAKSVDNLARSVNASNEALGGLAKDINTLTAGQKNLDARVTNLENNAKSK